MTSWDNLWHYDSGVGIRAGPPEPVIGTVEIGPGFSGLSRRLKSFFRVPKRESRDGDQNFKFQKLREIFFNYIGLNRASPIRAEGNRAGPGSPNPCYDLPVLKTQRITQPLSELLLQE